MNARSDLLSRRPKIRREKKPDLISSYTEKDTKGMKSAKLNEKKMLVIYIKDAMPDW